MKHLLVFIFTITACCTAAAQIQVDHDVSKTDSLLLNDFWQSFKKAIDNKDKVALSQLLNFPFYCPPCVNYVKPNDHYHVTVKVNRKILDTAAYKTFFEIPTLNSYNAKLWKEGFYFNISHDDHQKKTGFVFSYALIEPSKSWEGSQGFIFLEKKKDRYIIVGMDTVP